MTRTPDFFIVGAIKSGTTALYEYLRRHPEIYMPEVKEPYFFGSDMDADYFVRDWDEYLALFGEAGDACRIGEASTGYLYSRVAAREIRERLGPVRIIIMLRNPVDVMYAHHSQLLEHGSEVISDFAEALEAEADRKRGERVPEKAEPPEGLYYREAVRFHEQVRRYFDVFGRELVHVIVFDDLVRDTPTVYRRVLRFLEVDDAFRPEFRVVNPNRRLWFPGLRRWLKDPPDLVRRLGRVLLPSRRLRIRLVELLVRLNAPTRPRPPMDPALRRRLLGELAPEIDRLGALVDRDLSHWYRDEPAPGDHPPSSASSSTRDTNRSHR